MVKNLPAMQETRVQSLGQEDPLEKGMAATSVFLEGEFHGQRSLVGYSPWCRKESDVTEQLTLTHLLRASQVVLVVKNLPTSSGRHKRHRFDSHNPLQNSCLGNPMDRGGLQSTGSQRVGHNVEVT